MKWAEDSWGSDLNTSHAPGERKTLLSQHIRNYGLTLGFLAVGYNNIKLKMIMLTCGVTTPGNESIRMRTLKKVN